MSEPVDLTTAPSDPSSEGSTLAPVLRREALLPRERRGGLGPVALLCSLAGVASGFALATTILATQLAAENEARCMRRAPMHEHAALGVVYDPRSATVLRVLGGTPAADIGLRAGDRIVRVDGEPIDEIGELGRRIRGAGIGHEASLEVRRGATTMILHPTLVGMMIRDTQL